MALGFGNIRVGDFIFNGYISQGRAFVQPIRVLRIRTGYGSNVFFDYSSRTFKLTTPHLPSEFSTIEGWNNCWSTTLDECVNTLSKTRTIFNLLSEGGTKFSFYDSKIKKVISEWYSFSSNAGFYQTRNKQYGIIKKDNLYSVTDNQGNPLTDKWFQKIKKCPKEKYVIGINTISKKSEKDNISYKIDCTEEEKICLPDYCLTQTKK